MIFVLDGVEIDDSKQTITIDFGISTRWLDSRLVDKAGQVIPSEEAWVPNLQLMSLKDVRETSPKGLARCARRADRIFTAIRRRNLAC